MTKAALLKCAIRISLWFASWINSIKSIIFTTELLKLWNCTYWYDIMMNQCSFILTYKPSEELWWVAAHMNFRKTTRWPQPYNCMEVISQQHSIIPFFDRYVTLVGTVPISWSTTVDTLAEDTCIFGPSNPHKILSLEGLEIPILSHLYSQLFNIYSRRVLQNFKNKILKTKYE